MQNDCYHKFGKLTNGALLCTKCGMMIPSSDHRKRMVPKPILSEGFEDVYRPRPLGLILAIVGLCSLVIGVLMVRAGTVPTYNGCFWPEFTGVDLVGAILAVPVAIIVSLVAFFSSSREILYTRNITEKSGMGFVVAGFILSGLNLAFFLLWFCGAFSQQVLA